MTQIKKIARKSRSKIVIPFVAFVLAIGMLSSCKKDNNDNSSTEVTVDDAADAVAGSVASETDGMSATVSTTTELAARVGVFTTTPSINCGQEYTTSYAASASNSGYSYNYTGSTHYQLTCSDSLPSSFTFGQTMDGVYETPRMSSDDDVTGNWTLSGLEPSVANTSFSGSYVRNGSQVSKVRNQRSFTSTITITANNVTVNKSTYKITGGTASVSMNGTSSAGNTYTYEGSITFNGNDTATLTINGNTYTIDL